MCRGRAWGYMPTCLLPSSIPVHGRLICIARVLVGCLKTPPVPPFLLYLRPSGPERCPLEREKGASGRAKHVPRPKLCHSLGTGTTRSSLPVCIRDAGTGSDRASARGMVKGVAPKKTLFGCISWAEKKHIHLICRDSDVTWDGSHWIRPQPLTTKKVKSIVPESHRVFWRIFFLAEF